MPVFITITDADITNPAFWASLNIDNDSTINTAGISDTIQITMTGTQIVFTDTISGTVTTYTNADLAGGSFSNFVQFTGNDAGSDVSGSVGLNAQGYTGGTGDDVLTDSGNLGGGIVGGAGNDTLTGGTGNNNIFGGDGDDVLSGGGGNNNLDGGAGNDTLYGNDGSGNLIGGAGDDTIYVGLNTTFVDGNDGNDFMILPEGATFAPFFPGANGGTITMPGGRTFTYLNIAAGNITVACFTEGTDIRTPWGQTPVEQLCVGDLVDTYDDGPQPIRWIGKRTVPAIGKMAPVHLSAGSVGNQRALCVSPQHRILMSGWRAELLLGENEVLCAAKHLCDGDRIYVAPAESVTYFHIMFDKHQIVFSNDVPSESFFVGDYQSQADAETYEELTTLFPELAAPDHPARRAARPFIKHYEAKLLMENSAA